MITVRRLCTWRLCAIIYVLLFVLVFWKYSRAVNEPHCFISHYVELWMTTLNFWRLAVMIMCLSHVLTSLACCVVVFRLITCSVQLRTSYLLVSTVRCSCIQSQWQWLCPFWSLSRCAMRSTGSFITHWFSVTLQKNLFEISFKESIILASIIADAWNLMCPSVVVNMLQMEDICFIQ